MDFLVITLATLAVYRVSTDIAWSRGPFDLFDAIREQIGAAYPAEHWIAEGVRCPNCISFWLSLIAGVLVGWPWPPAMLLAWLGIAGGAALLLRLPVGD